MARLEWLEEMNYEIVEGPDIAPDGDYTERESFHDVVLVDRLRDSLQKINPALDRKVIEEAIQKLSQMLPKHRAK